jgi:hypothetical protein
MPTSVSLILYELHLDVDNVPKYVLTNSTPVSVSLILYLLNRLKIRFSGQCRSFIPINSASTLFCVEVAILDQSVYYILFKYLNSIFIYLGEITGG